MLDSRALLLLLYRYTMRVYCRQADHSLCIHSDYNHYSHEKRCDTDRAFV